jgi:C4-dicarboxylate transporter, DctQ subunit
MTEARERREPVNGWRKIILLYDRTLSIFEFLLLMFAAILFAVMILVVTYSVLGRTFFGLPGAFSVEISEYIMVYLTFLAAPWVLKEHGHVRIDLVVSAVGPRVRTAFRYITTFVAASACLILFWFSLNATISYYQRDVVFMKVLNTPEYLILAVIPLGSLFLFLRFTCQLLEVYVAEIGEEGIDQKSVPEA